MKHLTPQIIAEITGGRYVGGEGMRHIRVRGAVRDNRDVMPGNLFVCFKGSRADGHSYAKNAFEAGASCCLTERELPDAAGPYVIVGSTAEAIRTIGEYHRSLFDIPVIGITGSVGKTTAKELVAAALGARYRVLKTEKNLNNELGVPLTLLAIDEQHEAAVIEMGISGFGEMSRLAQMVRPDFFIITKIGYAHLEALGDLNGVLRAKTEAFACMKPDGIAIVNGDDELLLGYDPGLRKVTYGLGEHNDVCLKDIGGRFSCVVKSQESRLTTPPFEIKIPAYGKHIAELAGAAVAAGLLLGLTGAEIAEGLTAYEPISGRADITKTGYITLIDDCYNANPNSVKAALASLSELSSPRVAILGDMLELGPQSADLHRQIGIFAAGSHVDRLICCGDMAIFIYEGFISASGGKEAMHYRTKAELMAMLHRLIKKDDTVLVKASNGMQFNEIAQRLMLMG